jgi:hypothetical protein
MRSNAQGRTMPSIADRRRAGRLCAVGLTALVGSLALGCHHPPPMEGPYAAISTPQRAEPYQTVVVVDPQISGRVSIDRQGVQRDENGRLAVQVFVRNRTNFPQAVEAQTAFRDAQGFDINDETAWQRLNMGPNETQVYRAISLDSRAAFYVVRLREGM